MLRDKKPVLLSLKLIGYRVFFPKLRIKVKELLENGCLCYGLGAFVFSWV